MPTLATAVDPLSLLAPLYAPPYLVRLVSLPDDLGWRLEHSEDNGQTWASLSPASGSSSPLEAIQAGVQAIADWRTSRTTAHDAEIVHYLKQGKLERRKIQIINGEESMYIDGYAAQGDNGEWLEDQSPIEAINKAKESSKVKVKDTRVRAIAGSKRK